MIGRRNLTDFQKNEIALRYEELIKAKAKMNQKLSKGQGFKVASIEATLKPIKTSEEIGKIAGTNRGSVERTKFILKNGTEEQIERARTGTNKCQ